MSSESNHNACSGVKESEITSCAVLSGSGESRSHRRKNSVEALLPKQVLPPQMTTKMKGLLKGLRYISQIFEPNGKEQEMQIGYPTDVKHVAHIGWDGPSVNAAPSWMNGFQPTPEHASAPPSTTGETKEQVSPPKRTSQGSRRSSSRSQDSQNRDLPELPKPSRRHQTQDSPNDEQSDAPKASRRHQSASSSTNSSTGEASDAPRQSRRHSHKSSSGLDSSTKESNHSRRKKSNKSSDGGSVRSSRSKSLAAADSDPDVKNSEECLPALKPKEEEKIEQSV